VNTAIVYPGICFIEATNVSEGRGTPHPFIWIGAPWIDGFQLSREMNSHNLPGVVFKPITFTPKTIPGVAVNPKYENELCSGIEITVTDRDSYESVKTGIFLLSVLQKLYPDDFQISEKGMNRLVGNDLIVKTLSQLSPREIIDIYSDSVVSFNEKRKEFLIYP
jgi:uncharacterized protein YbbC (DUF1343 family)